MSEKTIVAIMYDFDRTLSTRDMQIGRASCRERVLRAV